MTTTFKISSIFSVVALMVIAFGAFTMSAAAFGDSEDGGCCGGGGYSQGSYHTYGQSSYYSQGSYNTYGQGSYYSQSSYAVKAKCVSLTADKQTLPYGGGTVKLTWATQNAQSASINNGVGTVTPTSGGSVNVNVTDDITYTLTAVGTGGNGSCTVSIDVEENQDFSCEYLHTSKSVVEKGESFTLSWKTINADSVSINQGIGSVSANGSLTTSTQEGKTYTLTAKKGNQSKTCPVSVSVHTDTYSQGNYYSQGSYGGGGSKSPRCDLDISAKKIKKGKEITLEWKTSNATDILLKDNHGKTLIDTDDLSSRDKKEFLDGDIKVRPTKDTTYTLIAEKGSKDDECKVKVEVEDEVVVLETRDQMPFVQGIALTHVPYTGFEAGPVLTFIFYALLTLWALFVAYVLVIKKKAS